MSYLGGSTLLFVPGSELLVREPQYVKYEKPEVRRQRIMARKARDAYFKRVQKAHAAGRPIPTNMPNGVRKQHANAILRAGSPEKWVKAFLRLT